MRAATGQASRVSAPAPPTSSLVTRWLPFAATVVFATAVLLMAGTSIVDIGRYAAYAGLGVALPGTLVYRSLRGAAYTFVEDVAMGTALGLVLELAAWALWSALGLQGWLWLWPLAVVVPYAVVPRLRRHWRVTGHRATPVGWAWAVAGVVMFFTAYLSIVFLQRNPILPASDSTLQYVDLAYQQSLAADALRHVPVGIPQVAGEPLPYHWFGYAHMASSSLVGHIDLPVVTLRFAVPALCALAIVLTGVVGWRVSNRPYVGAGAAALFFVIGEVNFTHPVTFPFGTQATFVVWHGMSMIYSWVLLLALIGAACGVLTKHALGFWLLTGLFLFASSGAKASSVPVAGLALLITAIALFATSRRIPWRVIGLGLFATAAQLFAMAVLFRFQTHGLRPDLGQGFDLFIEPDRGGWRQALVVAVVFAAFVVNMLLRYAGIVPLVWLRRGRLTPVQWFLLGGALAGPILYLTLGHESAGNQYFTRAGFTFGVILSAWGFALALEKADLTRRGKAALGGFALALAVALSGYQLAKAGPPSGLDPFAQVLPIVYWSVGLLLIGLLAALVWTSVSPRLRVLDGKGGLVVLTALLVIGAPGLVMDAKKGWESPNGGAYYNVPMPLSRVEAARWVRDHSRPDDILATNVHCIQGTGTPCWPASFWLSAYAERRVNVEGWAFAPRVVAQARPPFWDPARLEANDVVFTAPTAENLRVLRERYGVRFLVVDRDVEPESPELATLATKPYDNGRVAVYELP